MLQAAIAWGALRISDLGLLSGFGFRISPLTGLPTENLKQRMPASATPATASWRLRFEELGHEGGPTCLMAGAEATAGFGVEVFVE